MISKLLRILLKLIPEGLKYTYRGSNYNIRPPVWDTRLIKGPRRDEDACVMGRLREDRAHPVIRITTAHFRDCSGPLRMSEERTRENAATTTEPKDRLVCESNVPPMSITYSATFSPLFFTTAFLIADKTSGG